MASDRPRIYLWTTSRVWHWRLTAAHYPTESVVTEYQLHRLVGPVCGEATRAALPTGVPRGGLGPRVQAVTALCTGAYHLSRRTTQTVLEALFGVSMSLGTVANLEQATPQALVAPVAEARACVHAQPVAYLDETGWREGRQRAWWWTAVTSCVTVFVVQLSRGAMVAQALLGERVWGWLVTDCWRAYTWYPVWRRQVCWAHLLRDIAAMIERGGSSAKMGEALQAQAGQMLHGWHRVRDGTLAHASFETSRRPIRQEVERLLTAGQTCGVPNTAGVCRESLNVRQTWWTFVRHPGVEPTNHAAERAIRPGVLWRKGRFGTQSAEGSRVVETLMTVVATLRGEPAPSLIPTPADIQQTMLPAA
jgi:transposase